MGTQLVKVLGSEHELLLWEYLDLDKDFEELNKKVGASGVEHIINAIAYNAVDACENDEQEYEKAKALNITLPEKLARIALENKIGLFHYSTDYVFGAYKEEELAPFVESGGFSETDTPRPANRYALTKAAGEKAILALAESGLRCAVIRTSKLFGPKGDSEFAKPSFFDIMISLAEKNDELKVVDSEASCFTFTPDLAIATKKLLSQGYSGIYHFVNEGIVTWYEGTLALFDIIGKKTKITAVTPDTFPRPAERPTFSALKNNRFPLLRDYKDALRDYLDIKKCC